MSTAGRPVKSWLVLALMLGSSALAWALTPTRHMADESQSLKLEAAIPAAFGEWTLVPEASAAVVDAGRQQLIDRIYDQTLTRVYVNPARYVMMLSIAYGRDQSDGFGLHQPEVCYPAQGFELLGSRFGEIPIGDRTMPVKRLNAALGSRIEPITYWTVIGERHYQGGLQKKMRQIAYGFSGRIADGMLIRISSIDPQTEAAYRLQAAFAADLVAAVPDSLKPRFTGMLAAR
ncbi:EpsI family protein [Xylophilus sp. Kf1]|nr:EpsI family protein [Xylophilus sp. Kf1]